MWLMVFQINFAVFVPLRTIVCVILKNLTSHDTKCYYNPHKSAKQSLPFKNATPTKNHALV